MQNLGAQMTLPSFSPNALTTYRELLRLHQDLPSPLAMGSLEKRTRNGRTYLYDKVRIGTEMKSRYLGEATPELCAKLTQTTEEKTASEARQRDMARLANVLRAEGLQAVGQGTGSLLTAFARAGVFRRGGMVLGSAAFALYHAELGVDLDSDLLSQGEGRDLSHSQQVSIALGAEVEQDPGDGLKMLSFDPDPSSLDPPCWIWRQSRNGERVCFLIPASETEAVIPLPDLGVTAQAWAYLDFLMVAPIPAVALYRSGVLVQIPRPERYAIHKMIVAARRPAGPDSAEARKDRAQAKVLVQVLAKDRRDDLRVALEDVGSRGSDWHSPIDASLERMPQTADILMRILHA